MTSGSTPDSAATTRSRRLMGRQILLAADGSTNAGRAAELVADLAGVLEARVTVASVASIHGDPPVVPWQAPETHRPIPHARAAEWSHPWVERLREAGIVADEIVLDGPPAEALISAASESSASLIVIGRCGAGGGCLHLGSVAEELAERSPCAVLIVP
jgi:nucleotide-binding universal stress UspA family protein